MPLRLFRHSSFASSFFAMLLLFGYLFVFPYFFFLGLFICLAEDLNLLHDRRGELNLVTLVSAKINSRVNFSSA